MVGKVKSKIIDRKKMKDDYKKKPKKITYKLKIKDFEKEDDPKLKQEFLNQEKAYIFEQNKPYNRQIFDEHLNEFTRIYPYFSPRFKKYEANDIYNKIVKETNELFKNEQNLLEQIKHRFSKKTLDNDKKFEIDLQKLADEYENEYDKDEKDQSTDKILEINKLVEKAIKKYNDMDSSRKTVLMNQLIIQLQDYYDETVSYKTKIPKKTSKKPSRKTSKPKPKSKPKKVIDDKDDDDDYVDVDDDSVDDDIIEIKSEPTTRKTRSSTKKDDNLKLLQNKINTFGKEIEKYKTPYNFMVTLIQFAGNDAPQEYIDDFYTVANSLSKSELDKVNKKLLNSFKEFEQEYKLFNDAQNKVDNLMADIEKLFKTKNKEYYDTVSKLITLYTTNELIELYINADESKLKAYNYLKNEFNEYETKLYEKDVVESIDDADTLPTFMEQEKTDLSKAKCKLCNIIMNFDEDDVNEHILSDIHIKNTQKKTKEDVSVLSLEYKDLSEKELVESVVDTLMDPKKIIEESTSKRDPLIEILDKSSDEETTQKPKGRKTKKKLAEELKNRINEPPFSVKKKK